MFLNRWKYVSIKYLICNSASCKYFSANQNSSRSLYSNVHLNLKKISCGVSLLLSLPMQDPFSFAFLILHLALLLIWIGILIYINGVFGYKE